MNTTPSLKSYVVTDCSGLNILLRVHARNEQHAAEKIEAIYGGMPAKSDRLMTYADYCSDRDCALEPMGLAPWQKRLNREESKNQFPLV